MKVTGEEVLESHPSVAAVVALVGTVILYGFLLLILGWEPRYDLGTAVDLATMCFGYGVISRLHITAKIGRLKAIPVMIDCFIVGIPIHLAISGIAGDVSMDWRALIVTLYFAGLLGFSITTVEGGFDYVAQATIGFMIVPTCTQLGLSPVAAGGVVLGWAILDPLLGALIFSKAPPFFFTMMFLAPIWGALSGWGVRVDSMDVSLIAGWIFVAVLLALRVVFARIRIAQQRKSNYLVFLLVVSFGSLALLTA